MSRVRRNKGMLDESDSDELPSEDELLAQFNMTSKSRKSPQYNRSPLGDAQSRKSPALRSKSPGDMFAAKPRRSPLSHETDDSRSDLMMTLRAPLDASGKNWSQSMYRERDRKSSALKALEEINSGSRSPQLDQQTWQPPALRKTSLADLEKNKTAKARSKSPGSRDRSVRENGEDDRRTLSPHSYRSSVNNSPGLLRESPSDEVDGMWMPKMKQGKQYTDDSYHDNRNSPALDRRVSPHFAKQYEEQKSPHSLRPKFADRRSPLDENRKSPSSLDDRRSPRRRKTKSPVEEKYSVSEKQTVHKRTPGSSPEPLKTNDGRKTPTGRETPNERAYGRKGSVLDLMEKDEQKSKQTLRKGKKNQHSRKSHLQSSDEDSDEDTTFAKMQQSRSTPKLTEQRRLARSPSGNKTASFVGDDRQHASLEDDYHPIPKPRVTKNERQGRSANRSPARERESSVCREVEKDPSSIGKKVQDQDDSENTSQQKPQRKEKHILDEVIESVKDAQDDKKTMRFIDPAKPTDEDKIVKGQRTHLKKFKPEPRYAKPVVNSKSASLQSQSCDSSSSIRESVFQEWYMQRQAKMRKDALEKKKRQKEEEEKKQKAQLDKELESKASFDAWKKSKSSEDHEKVKKKLEEEAAKKQKEEDTVEKKKVADLAYRTWKEDRDASYKEKVWQKSKQETMKVEETESDKERKRKDAQSAYRKWKEQKDEKLKSKVKEENNTVKQREKEEWKAQQERNQQAEETYREWTERKEKQERKTRELKQQKEYEEEMPPWSPASRTIPAGR